MCHRKHWMKKCLPSRNLYDFFVWRDKNISVCSVVVGMCIDILSFHRSLFIDGNILRRDRVGSCVFVRALHLMDMIVLLLVYSFQLSTSQHIANLLHFAGEWAGKRKYQPDKVTEPVEGGCQGDDMGSRSSAFVVGALRNSNRCVCGNYVEWPISVARSWLAFWQECSVWKRLLSIMKLSCFQYLRIFAWGGSGQHSYWFCVDNWCTIWKAG